MADYRADILRNLKASGPNGLDLREYTFPGLHAHIESLMWDGYVIRRVRKRDEAGRMYERLVLVRQPADDVDQPSVRQVREGALA